MSAIPSINDLKERIFNDLSPGLFNDLALQIFRYQAESNILYRNYIAMLGLNVKSVTSYLQIPFLPISFFKNHRVVSGTFQEEAVFSSSGTTGMTPSMHYIKELSLYEKSFVSSFKRHYGEPGAYRILALLPSYLERKDSSLVFMAEHLMKAGAYPESGFFLNDHKTLAEVLRSLNAAGQKTILIGVSFALIDFMEEYSFPLGDHIIMMETGGMKGRKEEITREDLHQRLEKAFQVKMIHSEYGMTELLSQAYSCGRGIYHAPPWMKILIRDITDPFRLVPDGQVGAINIIDLANIHSCAFIETQDIGKMHPNGGFEVFGRTDHSDIRGCSLLIQ